MVEQAAHQSLGLFVLHKTHLGPTRPLQTRSEEPHSPAGAVDESHVHLAEVVLTELARHTLETHLEVRRRRPELSDQVVHRGLAAVVAALATAAKNLQRHQPRVAVQQLDHERTIRLSLARPTHTATLTFDVVVHMSHGLLLSDAANAAH